MSTETERARIKTELEALETKRRGLETELELVEKESDKPVYTRAALDRVSPPERMTMMLACARGEAQFVD